MADDIDILDAVGGTKTVRARDKGSKFFQLVTNECQSVAAPAAGSVSSTASKLVGPSGTIEAHTGRRYVRIQNLGPDPMYVGATNAVTTANGLKVGVAGDIELPWGDAVEVWAVSEGTSDARVSQGG